MSVDLTFWEGSCQSHLNRSEFVPCVPGRRGLILLSSFFYENRKAKKLNVVSNNYVSRVTQDAHVNVLFLIRDLVIKLVESRNWKEMLFPSGKVSILDLLLDTSELKKVWSWISTDQQLISLVSIPSSRFNSSAIDTLCRMRPEYVWSGKMIIEDDGVALMLMLASLIRNIFGCRVTPNHRTLLSFSSFTISHESPPLYVVNESVCARVRLISSVQWFPVATPFDEILASLIDAPGCIPVRINDMGCISVHRSVNRHGCYTLQGELHSRMVCMFQHLLTSDVLKSGSFDDGMIMPLLLNDNVAVEEEMAAFYHMCCFKKSIPYDMYDFYSPFLSYYFNADIVERRELRNMFDVLLSYTLPLFCYCYSHFSDDSIEFVSRYTPLLAIGDDHYIIPISSVLSPLTTTYFIGYEASSFNMAKLCALIEYAPRELLMLCDLSVFFELEDYVIKYYNDYAFWQFLDIDELVQSCIIKYPGSWGTGTIVTNETEILSLCESRPNLGYVDYRIGRTFFDRSFSAAMQTE